MNDATEFTAACPEPHIILGLRLLPLSLGRYKLLKRFNSPFVSDDEQSLDLKRVTEELFFSLVICGLTCKEFADLENKGFKRQLKRWGKRVQKYIKRERYFSILEKAAAFKRYLDEETQVPWRIFEKETNEEQSPVHWSTSIEVVLMSKVGWTEEKINESPMLEALVHYFKYLESEGHVKLVSPEVYDQMQELANENGAVFEALVMTKK